MKEMLTYLTKSLVKFPNDVIITEQILEDSTIVFTLKVNPEDMGRIIGRNGKTARAVRLLVSAKAASLNKRSKVEIADEGERNRPSQYNNGQA